MTDKTISVYWFFILFIIASAIVFVVYSLFGKSLDVREMETIFLAEKVADCVSQGGTMTNEGQVLIEKGNEENLLEICRLNFEVEEYRYWKNDQLFVSVKFGEGNPILVGNLNLNSPESNINFFGSNRQFPFCVDRIMYSYWNEKIYSIKIVACVRKTEKNV